MTPDRLDALLARFPSLRLAVLGDYFLDKYLDVDPARAETSLETGRTAHQVVAVRCSPGAAGTVVANLAALGAGTLFAIGYTGEDGEGFDLRRGLARLGCSSDHLHAAPDRMTPTYLKPRDIADPGLAGEHERYDTQNRTPTADVLAARVLASLDALLPDLDAVIVQDQVELPDCGVVTAAVRRALAERAARHPDVTFWADSRAHIRRFRNVIVKPNQFEAAEIAGPPPEGCVEIEHLKRCVVALRKTVGAPVVATRGAAGALSSDPEPTLVRGVRVDGPVDPTGAGDSLTAGSVLALAAGASLPEAVLVGNLVASITVQQLATTGTASPEAVRERLALWQAQVNP